MFWNFYQYFVDSYTVHVSGFSVKVDWKQKSHRKNFSWLNKLYGSSDVSAMALVNGLNYLKLIY